jgi:uncharacterized protein
MGIVDACVHPIVPAPGDLNRYMRKPYSLQRLNRPMGGIYHVPIDEYVVGSRPVDGSLPGSDPRLMDRDVLEEPGADVAILLPLARGLPADPQMCAAIDSATNEWLAETWLTEHSRYRGSIRVTPRSPADAVREIERWADDPRFVQVAVPLEANLTYGEQVYFPVWEAAAEHGLPVAIHCDFAGGVLRPPTVAGYPISYLEMYTQAAAYGIAHLVSLIAHGVFDRLESLVFVFADGGFDYVTTLMWRVDKDWRAARAEVPWMKQLPSRYLADHARFVVHRSDGDADAEEFARFVELNGFENLLLYGSNYPHWDHLPAAPFAESLPDRLRVLLMEDNARRLYGLPVAEGSPA